MHRKALIILVFCTFLPNLSKGQGTSGKDFWVAFMAQDWYCYYNYSYVTRDTPELFLSSQFAATVTITADSQNFSKTIVLEPNVTTEVSLPSSVVCRFSDSISYNGVHITADTTINVYAVNRYWWSKGATVVIPSTSIVESPEYFITTNEDKYNWGWYCNGKKIQSPEFTIVGVADSSVIEIVPTGASSRNSNANVPFQITLKKGQTFQYITSDQDLSGSIIRSKYVHSKYAVFSGNRQTYTMRANCFSSWDHTYEQMLPTVSWGQKYTALPFKDNISGYTLKIVAAENNTRVYINGSYYTTLNQAKFCTYEVLGDSVVHVEGTNRISVAQFTLGGYCQNSAGAYNHPTTPWLGDPSQMQIFPDEQFGKTATVNTVSQSYWWWWWNSGWWWWWQSNKPEHYINVMTKTADTAQFLLNNSKPTHNVWKTSGRMPGFHYAQFKIDSGSHYLQSNKGFLAYVYGYNWYEGYAYAAAANFRAIQNNFLITNAQCKKDTVLFQAVTNDSFGNYKWTFGDNSPMAYGPRVRHKYADTGWYTVVMYCYHKRTNAMDSVTKVLYVADTKIKSLFDNDTLVCGKVEFVVISKGFNVDNEYTWNDGHPVYYRAIKNPGIYWLEVKERNGCVFRDTLKVAQGALPHPDFSVSKDVFCLNRSKSVEFTNNSTSKDSVLNYVWDFGVSVVTTTNRDSVFTYNFPKANTYPVILRVNTLKGCYHDTFMIVDVLPSPKADFSFTKKDTCFSTNQIVLKNNTVVNQTYHRRYKWFFSEGFVQSNSNPGTHNYTATGDYKVMLIYENTNGCIDTMTQSVKIVPNPVAGFTYSNSVFCSRDTITLTNTSASAYTPLAYKWNFGDSTTSTDSFPEKAWKKGGTFTAKLLVTAPTGCKDSTSKSILVNPTPLVDFSINKDTQCFVGHNFTYTNKTQFGGGALAYTWKLGDGNTSSDSNILTKTYARDSVYTIELSTTTNLGCFAKATKKAYLGGYPDAKFQVNQLQQCYRNNQFLLTNQSTISRGSLLRHLWSLGNNDTSMRLNVKQHYTTEDSFTIRLIEVSNLGCRDTASRQVVTFAQPKANFSVNNAVQCFNEHGYTFKNLSSVKYGSTSYSWKFGDNTSSDSVNPKKRYSAAGVYSVSLIATSLNNCSDTLVKTMTVNPNPKAGFSISQFQQCFRDNHFDFTNTSTLTQGSIASYQWDMGDVSQFITANVSNKQYLREDTFNVRMVVTSDKGCTDTARRLAITFAQPKARFAVNNDVQCFKQQNFALKNQTTLKYGQLTYQWSFGDGKTSTDTNYNKKYARDSTYNIRLVSTSDHNCRDTAFSTVVLNVSPDAVYQLDKDKQCFRGNVFNFVNKSSVKKGSIKSYEWEMGDNNSYSTVDVLKYTYTTEDTFHVKLIARTDKNCNDTMTRLAITFAQPIVKFVIPNDSQCWQKNFFAIINNTKLKYGTLDNTWEFGDGTFSKAFQPSDKQYPNKSDDYIMKYKAVSDHGCSDSAQHRIVLLERPISNFSINDSIQCFRSHQFTFTNTTTFSAMYTMRYWWDYANGDTSMGFTPKTAKFNQPGLYDMRLISYSYLTNCYDTLYKTLVPAPHATPAFTMNADSQCLRFNKFVMSNTSKVMFGNMTWKWDFGDGTKDTGSNPVKSYIAEGSYRIRLVATTNYGCADSLDTGVGFYATPKAAFSINDPDQCLNKQGFDFANNSTISRGTFAPQWWYDDLDGSSSINVSNKQFTTAGDHIVRLSLLSDKGCKDTIEQTVYLENNHNSTIDFPESDSQCLRGNVFNFTNTNHNSKVSFVSSKWVYGDGQESTLAAPAAQSFTQDGSFKVMLVTVSATGCSDTTFADVVIHPHPVTAFKADKVCYPEPVQFTNTSSVKTGSIASYDWQFGDGDISTVSDPLHYYQSFGQYDVTLRSVSEYGCADTLKVVKAANVQQKPKADFTFEILSTIAVDESRLQFTNHSSNASTYLWDFGNSTSSSEESPIATFRDTGRYHIMLVAFSSEGCSDTIRKPSGAIIPDFFFYLPNAFSPDNNSHNDVYRGLGGSFVFSFKMEIFNRWGEKLFETNDLHQGWDGTYQGGPCQQDTYLCRVQIVPFKGHVKVYEQMFTLLR